MLDDDVPIAELMRVILEEVGMSVTVRTGSGELPAGPFDRIVTDLLTMTSYDRGQAREWLQRLSGRYPGVPVIVVSAHPEAARDSEALGARRVLLKPFDVDQLVAAVTS